MSAAKQVGMLVVSMFLIATAAGLQCELVNLQPLIAEAAYDQSSGSFSATLLFVFLLFVPPDVGVERIDGVRDGSDTVHIEQLVSGEVRVALVVHAMGKVTHVGNIVGAKDPMKLIPDSLKVGIVSDIGVVNIRGIVDRGIGENNVLGRSCPAIARDLHVGFPALRSAAGYSLLVKEANLPVPRAGERGVSCIGHTEQIT